MHIYIVLPKIFHSPKCPYLLSYTPYERVKKGRPVFTGQPSIKHICFFKSLSGSFHPRAVRVEGVINTADLNCGIRDHLTV